MFLMTYVWTSSLRRILDFRIDVSFWLNIRFLVTFPTTAPRSQTSISRDLFSSTLRFSTTESGHWVPITVSHGSCIMQVCGCTARRTAVDCLPRLQSTSVLALLQRHSCRAPPQDFEMDGGCCTIEPTQPSSGVLTQLATTLIPLCHTGQQFAISRQHRLQKLPG